MKRIISYIIVLCIVLSSTILVYSEGNGGQKVSTPAGTVVKEGNVVVENDNYLLDFNVEKLWFQVTDKRNGFVWGSNYLSNAEDETALGIIKTDMMSSLVVKYAFNGTTKDTNSFVSVVRNKNFTVRSIDGGVRVDYNFKDLGFNIPVEYVLDESGLKASVIASEITEDSTNSVVSVDLLPFFGSEQSKGAEGYAFVPDGSGAVISLSKKKSGIVRLYEKRVYGEDLFTASTLQTTYAQDIKAPVFGIKCGANAVAAVIESGAETAFICACAPGQLVDGAMVYSRYIHRANGNVEVTMQNGSKTSSLFMSEPDNDFVKYTVKYSFLEGDNANYVGMANVYREHLKKNGLKDTSKGESTLYLSLYGGILKQSNFLGVPYKKVESLTTYEEAKKILEKFLAKDVKNISLGLKNYTNSSIKGMTEIEFDLLSSLGGKKGYNSLVSYAESKNIDLYSYADFFSFSASGNGIGKNSTKVYSLQKSPLRLKGFSLVDNYRVDTEATVSFVRPTKYQSVAETLVKNASKANVQGIALESIASSIISDYAKGYISRTDAKKMILTATETIKNKYSIVTSAANDYMWKYSNTVVDLPTYSSRYIIFDYDVPFLQIALKGIKDYSTEPLNLAGVSTESFLNAVEGCSNLKFDGIYADNSNINGTQLGDVFGANYESWFDISVKWQKEMKKIYTAVKDSEITAHNSDGNLAVTVYENGTRVYVNYSDKEAELDGVKIPALWYTLKEGN